MTEQELQRLEELANAAIKDGVIHRDNAFDIVRKTLPLIEEIRRLRGALEFYEYDENWTPKLDTSKKPHTLKSNVENDCGKTARKALEKNNG